MKINKPIIGCALSVLLFSCYQDKGNYDYKDVNNFSLSFSPQGGEGNIYLINQPGSQADTFLLSSVVTQTINQDDSNLKYTWYRRQTIDGVKEPYKDTIYGKDNYMVFPESKKSSWDVTLVVRDEKADLEYYNHAIVKTKVPFVNTWNFLHQDGEQMKLGNLEIDMEGNASWQPDNIKLMNNASFPRMTTVAYIPHGSDDFVELERLFIQSGTDSITLLNPFSLKIRGTWQKFGMQPGIKIKKIVGNTMASGPRIALIDANGKFYYSEAWGTPKFQRSNDKAYPKLNVTDAYMNAEGKTILWDAHNCQLLGCTDAGELGAIDGIRANQLKNKQAIWLGRGTTITKSGEGENALCILRDKNNGRYYFWNVDFGKSGGVYGKAHCDSLDSWGLTEKSLFAVSNAWDNQIFFAEDNIIYLGRLDSKEKSVVYRMKEGYEIKKMAFKVCNASTHFSNQDKLFYLGIIVTKDGTDSLCELKLSIAADVEEAKFYDLGEHTTVADFFFMAPQHEVDR